MNAKVQRCVVQARRWPGAANGNSQGRRGKSRVAVVTRTPARLLVDRRELRAAHRGGKASVHLQARDN
jgi:hypothetical protein